MLVLTDNGPVTYMTEVKIPVGKNIVANFADGKTGNFLALTDNDTGEIVRLLSPNEGYTESYKIKHPDTGITLMGTKIPNWSEIIGLAHRVARAFPGLKLQGWDITHTTSGMLPLELNLVTGRTMYNHQRLSKRGFMTPEVKAIYDRMVKKF